MVLEKEKRKKNQIKLHQIGLLLYRSIFLSFFHSLGFDLSLISLGFDLIFIEVWFRILIELVDYF